MAAALGRRAWLPPRPEMAVPGAVTGLLPVPGMIWRTGTRPRAQQIPREGTADMRLAGGVASATAAPSMCERSARTYAGAEQNPGYRPWQLPSECGACYMPNRRRRRVSGRLSGFRRAVRRPPQATVNDHGDGEIPILATRPQPPARLLGRAPALGLRPHPWPRRHDESRQAYTTLVLLHDRQLPQKIIFWQLPRLCEILEESHQSCSGRVRGGSGRWGRGGRPRRKPGKGC
jgi:hypothetical protein